jgi:MFS family permease
LLCESKQRLGFIGAGYFFGAIIASSLFPIGWLSDRYGRKWIFILSMGIEVVACYALIVG